MQYERDPNETHYSMLPELHTICLSAPTLGPLLVSYILNRYGSRLETIFRKSVSGWQNKIKLLIRGNKCENNN